MHDQMLGLNHGIKTVNIFIYLKTLYVSLLTLLLKTSFYDSRYENIFVSLTVF